MRPEGTAAIVGCPKCGTNGVMKVDANFTVTGSAININDLVECPGNKCGAKFRVVDSVVMIDEGDDA